MLLGAPFGSYYDSCDITAHVHWRKCLGKRVGEETRSRPSFRILSFRVLFTLLVVRRRELKRQSTYSVGPRIYSQGVTIVCCRRWLPLHAYSGELFKFRRQVPEKSKLFCSIHCEKLYLFFFWVKLPKWHLQWGSF